MSKNEKPGTPNGVFGAGGTASEVGKLIPKSPRVPQEAKATKTAPNPFVGDPLMPPTLRVRFANWRTATYANLTTRVKNIRAARKAAKRAKAKEAPKPINATRATRYGWIIGLCALAVMLFAMVDFVRPLTELPPQSGAKSAAPVQAGIGASTVVIERTMGQDMVFEIPPIVGIDVSKCVGKRIKNPTPNKNCQGQTGYKMVKGNLITCGCHTEIDAPENTDNKKGG